MNRYETVFILTPVLSDEQMKEAVKKFRDFLESNEASVTAFIVTLPEDAK